MISREKVVEDLRKSDNLILTNMVVTELEPIADFILSIIKEETGKLRDEYESRLSWLWMHDEIDVEFINVGGGPIWSIGRGDELIDNSDTLWDAIKSAQESTNERP